jgi:hypothetical protein
VIAAHQAIGRGRSLARWGDHVPEQWECGHCGAKEGRGGQGVRIDAVCHHCGKPLCPDHRHLMVDQGFSVDGVEASPEAVHCSVCQDLEGHTRAG